MNPEQVLREIYNHIMFKILAKKYPQFIPFKYLDGTVFRKKSDGDEVFFYVTDKYRNRYPFETDFVLLRKGRNGNRQLESAGLLALMMEFMDSIIPSFSNRLKPLGRKVASNASLAIYRTHTLMVLILSGQYKHIGMETEKNRLERVCDFYSRLYRKFGGLNDEEEPDWYCKMCVSGFLEHKQFRYHVERIIAPYSFPALRDLANGHRNGVSDELFYTCRTYWRQILGCDTIYTSLCIKGWSPGLAKLIADYNGTNIWLY
jgi:hypothetical protein